MTSSIIFAVIGPYCGPNTTPTVAVPSGSPSVSPTFAHRPSAWMPAELPVSVNRIQTRELLLLVIREADAVHAEQTHHLAQVCFEVLCRLAHLHFADGERVRQLVGLAGEAGFDKIGRASCKE